MMFVDPEIHEHLLLLVSINYAVFTTTWLSIYKEQALARAPITIYRQIFSPLEAAVAKDPK